MFGFRVKKDMKYCEDCRWFVENPHEAQCACPKAGVRNLIARNVAEYYCACIRSSGGGCGGDAKWFEQKANAAAANPLLTKD